MDAISAYVISHGVVDTLLWVLGGLVFLWLFGRWIFYAVAVVFDVTLSSLEYIERWIFDLIYYFQHQEIFSRQSEMEVWLQEQFDVVGIKVKFKNSVYSELGRWYKSSALYYENCNLFFVAEVPAEKVAAYRRIIGVALNRFPWTKIGSEGSFSPYRHLDRSWAEEYGIAKYACPRYSAPCQCGCNKVRIMDFEWKVLADTPKDEVILDSYCDYEFDCRTWKSRGVISLLHGDEHVLGKELVVELTPSQKNKLTTEVKRRDEMFARQRRGRPGKQH